MTATVNFQEVSTEMEVSECCARSAIRGTEKRKSVAIPHPTKDAPTTSNASNPDIEMDPE